MLDTSKSLRRPRSWKARMWMTRFPWIRASTTQLRICTLITLIASLGWTQVAHLSLTPLEGRWFKSVWTRFAACMSMSRPKRYATTPRCTRTECDMQNPREYPCLRSSHRCQGDLDDCRLRTTQGKYSDKLLVAAPISNLSKRNVIRAKWFKSYRFGQDAVVKAIKKLMGAVPRTTNPEISNTTGSTVTKSSAARTASGNETSMPLETSATS
jgi:hypothetical protein